MNRMILKARNFLAENDIINFGRNNRLVIGMFFCLIIGMVAGSISASYFGLETLDCLNSIFLNDFKQRISQSGFDVFISSLSDYFIFAIILELSALAAWGIASAPLILCFRGLGVGLSGGYLYLVYGLKGIAFYILILIPGIFISSIAFTLFGAEVFKTSMMLAKKVFPKGDDRTLWPSVKANFKKLGYCTIILCFSALVDMCFIMMFSGFFNF